MNHLKPKENYVALAEKIAQIMPEVGSDRQRGGWYDVVERTLDPDTKFHRYVWHDRKAWWQQEQAILAYLILAGSLDRPDFLKLARESSAFYNAWFLDYEAGGIYFNVLANGLPYLLGTERGKGSHSMSGYHSFELAYLATVYTNLLLTQQPMDLYFKPKPGGFENNILRVQPDILPPDSVHIGQVWINGQPYYDFDPNQLTVKLPVSQEDLKVRVRLLPVKVFFDATCIEVTPDTAKISLKGLLDASGIETLEEELQRATTGSIKRLVLLAQDLECITSAGLRSLVFIKQKLGSNVEIQIVGAQENVKNFLMMSSFYQGITLLDEEAIAPTLVAMATV
jgi:anti-anti-sigma factor